MGCAKFSSADHPVTLTCFHKLGTLESDIFVLILEFDFKKSLIEIQLLRHPSPLYVASFP